MTADVRPAEFAFAASKAGASGRPRVRARTLAAAVAGNALEFYDFLAYAFFAVYIGRAFFPAATPMGSLLLSVAVFGVGFVARPVGGLLFGAVADRVGRRAAMLQTIALITVGTIGLAATPGYASIGPIAPIAVVAFRLIQGLALGGEVGPSTSYLVEAAPAGRRARYASWQSASQGAAALVAGLMGLGLSLALSAQQMRDWGWRVPFSVALLLIPVALYLRRDLPETLSAQAVGASRGGLVALRRHRGVILLSTLAVSGGTISTYLCTYMTTFALTALRMPSAVAMGATVALGVALIAGALLGGWLGDRVGRRPVMLWTRVLVAMATVPAFALLMAWPNALTLYAVTGLLTLLTGVGAAALLTAIPELLPMGARATGLSLVYAVGVSLFGGTTQFIIAWLLDRTGNPLAPAW
ncbi:MAG: MFS transporter [Pelomonas sp.]|nr:MFS transporter [Roseateles sp.]